MNQPDVDTQSLGGALATGTHGTGVAYGAMHSEVTALKLLTVAGEQLSCSATQRPELLAAAQVSLGCLGVLTEVTLKVRPRHFLRRRAWVARNEELFEQAGDLARRHQHFEMFFLPHTGYGAAFVHDPVPATTVQHEEGADEDVLRDLQMLRDWLGRWPALRRRVAGWAVGRTPPEEAVDVSWRLLVNTRSTRFNETEGHVPREAGLACLREVLQALERRNDVFFPMEFRYVRGDNAWLSPFHGRDSCSIAVHALQGEPHDYLVREIGPVFRRHRARPHWGKLHDYKPEELAALYPRWRDFLALRRELDPQGRLLSPYMRRLLGLQEPA
jgi:FAD-linked oxidoreductase